MSVSIPTLWHFYTLLKFNRNKKYCEQGNKENTPCFKCKPLDLDYLPFSHPIVIIFLHAHLHIIPNLPMKFHQNSLSGLGVVLTRNRDRRTDGQTKGVISMYFVCQGYNTNVTYLIRSRYESDRQSRIVIFIQSRRNRIVKPLIRIALSAS